MKLATVIGLALDCALALSQRRRHDDHPGADRWLVWDSPEQPQTPGHRFVPAQRDLHKSASTTARESPQSSVLLCRWATLGSQEAPASLFATPPARWPTDNGAKAGGDLADRI